MIPRKNNIPTSYFPNVFKGISINGTNFRVVISHAINDNKPHIGIVIAKKHAKLATERNLFKRAVHAEVVKKIGELPNKTLLFLIQNPIQYKKTTIGRKMATQEVSKDVQNLLIKIIKKYEKNT